MATETPEKEALAQAESKPEGGAAEVAKQTVKDATAPKEPGSAAPKLTEEQEKLIKEYAKHRKASKPKDVRVDLLRRVLEINPKLEMTSYEKEALRTAQNGEADEDGKAKATRQRRPREWREGTFDPLYPKPDERTGSVLLARDPEKDSEGTMPSFTLIGRYDDEGFDYKKMRATLKRKGYDPDTVEILSIASRNARISRPPVESDEKAE